MSSSYDRLLRTVLASAGPLLIVSLVACTDNPAGVLDPNAAYSALIAPPGPPQPDAWSCTDPEDPHCLPPNDPCPDCDGIYVDFGLTMSECLTPGPTDLDYDGLGDWCEWAIARSFRPTFMIHAADQDPSREPYWAAKLYQENGTNCFLYPAPCYSPLFVQVFYAPSYHRDPGGPGGTYAHRGDSEFVVIWVSFDTNDGRWKTALTYTSAHFNGFGNPGYSRLNWADEVEYPSNYLGYPRVWVSKNKHANYPTQGWCNIGGIVGIDICDNNGDAGRLTVDLYRNLGSVAYPFLTGVASENPSYYRLTEDFWQADYFCGWMEYALFTHGCASPYKWWLDDFGY